MRKLFTILVAIFLAAQAWAQDFYVDNLKYSVTDATNRSVEVVGWTDGIASELTIPASVSYNGTTYSVTGIESWALRGCGITIVHISDGISSIESFAFENCKNLETVKIGSTVSSIDAFAFDGCSSLRLFTVVADNNNFQTVDGVLYSKDLKKLFLYPPGNLRTVYDVLEGVTTIGQNAFRGCQYLQILNIPRSVNDIWFQHVFLNSASLTEIYVDSDNSKYSSVDGVLIDDQDKTLVCYPAGKTQQSYTIPTGVTNIGNYAFCYCSHLETVIIPDDVAEIRGGAFSYCTGLTSVALPENISTISSYTFIDCTSLETVTIPEGVTTISLGAFSGCEGLTSVTIPNSVTTIGQNAFNGCKSIPSITIPEHVTSIGSNAFNDVNNVVILSDNVTVPSNYWGADSYTPGSEFIIVNGVLTGYDGQGGAVYIPQGVTAIGESTFANNTNIKSVFIPEGVTSIGNYAFQNSSLASVTIPNTVTTIGHYAFGDCPSLTSVTIPEGVTSIGSHAFERCSLASVTIPNTVTSIGNSAFGGCSSLVSVAIPEGVTSIGDYMFLGCSSLASVTIPEGVNSIGISAFNGCSSLTTVTIPNSVTSLGSYTFNGCSNLTSLIIPSTVENIGVDVFSGCDNLSYITVDGIKYHVLNDNGEVEVVANNYSGEIDIPATISLGDKTYTVTSIGDNAFYYCGGLTSVSIPEGVTGIGLFAFCDCSSLTSVTIPSTVTTIGTGAFYNCSSLPSITIPNKVTTIGEDAFLGCNGLIMVDIPSSVKTIGNNAFRDCSKLTSVTFSEGVETIGQWAFSGCDGLTSVDIPSSVTKIGLYDYESFYGCSNLSAINVDGGNQSYYSEDGVLYNKEKTKIISYPAGKTGTTYEILGSVTEIGWNVFHDCDNLESITIPEDVNFIGGSAFSNCSNLKSVNIPCNVDYIYDYTFSDCSNLTLTLPNASFIDNTAFSGVKKLVYPGTVAGNAYGANEVVAAFELSADGTLTRYNGQGGSVGIPEGVTAIGNEVFLENSDITAVYIPEGVETIGDAAFASCGNLQYVNIPKTVTSISGYAFRNCDKLPGIVMDADNPKFTSVDGVLFDKDEKTLICYPAGKTATSYEIPDGVETINWCAFSGCDNLKSVTIPESVKEIWGWAFDGCSNLSKIVSFSSDINFNDDTFEGSNLTIDDIEYGRPNGEENGNENNNNQQVAGLEYELLPGSKTATITKYNGTAPRTLTISETVTVEGVTYKVTGIAAGAFAGNKDIKNITIPASVTEIDQTAFAGCGITSLTCNTNNLGSCFAGCQSLESVTIGNNVKNIDAEAFKNCINLKSVTIGEAVQAIEFQAFCNCHALQSVDFGGVVYIRKEAFRGCHKIKTITVPEQVSSIGEDAFKYVKNVEYEGNAKGEPWGALTVNGYKEGDFIFTDATKKCLTAYVGSGSAAEVPSTATVIAHMAFFEAEGLKSVTIHGSVKKIENLAFANCFDLKDVNIPSSVLYIGKEAFRDSRSAVISCAASKKPTAWHGEWAIKVGKIQWNQPDDTVGVGIADDAAEDVTIYATGNTIVVENATDEIRVYDSMGRLVCRDVACRVRAEITINTPGVYIVRTGSTVKRVVVD